MKLEGIPGNRFSNYCGYQITVRGHLGQAMREWYGDLTIINRDDGTAQLILPQADQASLYGVLIQLRDWGFTLIEIQPLADKNLENST